MGILGECPVISQSEHMLQCTSATKTSHIIKYIQLPYNTTLSTTPYICTHVLFLLKNACRQQREVKAGHTSTKQNEIQWNSDIFNFLGKIKLEISERYVLEIGAKITAFNWREGTTFGLSYREVKKIEGSRNRLLFVFKKTVIEQLL